VKRQYCGQLGKRANCQALVSLTLARAEVPVCVGLRLLLPEDRCADAERRAAAGVPEAVAYRPKWRIALDEIDRVLASGARFGCVLADAEYGKAAEFRAGLGERGLAFAVGVLPAQKVYPADVALSFPARKVTGRPRKHPAPSTASVGAAELLAARPEAFRTVAWRTGTKGSLKAGFAAVRVRVADGPTMARGQHPPGEEVWLVAEHRAGGGRKYHLASLPIERRSRGWQRWSRRAGSASRRTSGSRRRRPRPPRVPGLARPASPRALVPARLRLPAAPAARGEKAPEPRPSPGRHPHRACPPSAGASSRL